MAEKITKLYSLAFKFGLLGMVGLLIGIMSAMLGYVGYDTDTFNPLHHTLSELGNYGHSPLAVVLNGGLFFGGLSLVMFALLSIQLINSGIGLLFLTSLAWVFASLAAVGLFPVNVYHLHVVALKSFFYASSCSTLLYVLYIATTSKPLYARWTIMPALMSFVCLTAFLFTPHIELGMNQNNRPFYQEMVVRVGQEILWWPAVLEWLSLLFIVIWTATMLQSKPKEKSPNDDLESL